MAIQFTPPENPTALSEEGRDEYFDQSLMLSAKVVRMCYDALVIQSGWEVDYIPFRMSRDDKANAAQLQAALEDEVKQLRLVLKNGGPRDKSTVEHFRWQALINHNIPRTQGSSEAFRKNSQASYHPIEIPPLSEMEQMSVDRDLPELEAPEAAPVEVCQCGYDLATCANFEEASLKCQKKLPKKRR